MWQCTIHAANPPTPEVINYQMLGSLLSLSPSLPLRERHQVAIELEHLKQFSPMKYEYGKCGNVRTGKWKRFPCLDWGQESKKQRSVVEEVSAVLCYCRI